MQRVFIRKPFTVEAERITVENIERIAEEVGELATKPDTGQQYIKLDPQKVPAIKNAYLGFWVTRMGRNTRCYSNKSFQSQFVPIDDHAESWIEYMNHPERWEEPVVIDTPVTNIFEAVPEEMPSE